MPELPILFRQQMLALLPEEADALLQALQTEPSVAVRVNWRKAMPPATDDPVAWCRSGIYLDARRQFTFDPLLHSGCYYVQDASSMFISHVLSQVAGNSPVAYLDLCAAPGGKTTAAIDALPDGSLVVANEIDSRRAQILRENVVKWGYPHCVVTNSDASRLGKLHEAFDIVAADMPCSGEGMMRKDDEAVAQWTPALVEQCAARQREIASDIWQALKPGGIFIYSTCTFNRAENEDMIDFLVRSLGAEPVDIVSDPSWGIHKGVDTPYPCFRFMPHLTRGEGLFMAVVRKNGEYAEKETKKDKNKSKKTSAKGVKGVECPKWIDGQDDFSITAYDDAICAVAKAHQPLVERIAKTAKTLLAGIPMAQAKGRDLVPQHALSQSVALRQDAFPCADLDYASAIAYLRGEAVALPADCPRGYVVVAYRNHPLGFVKNLGNRANNLYPKEWRIRSGHIPDETPEVI